MSPKLFLFWSSGKDRGQLDPELPRDLQPEVGAAGVHAGLGGEPAASLSWQTESLGLLRLCSSPAE